MKTSADPGERATHAVTRREFVGTGAMLGGCALFLNQVACTRDLVGLEAAGELSDAEAARLAENASIIYSVCLQCHTACPIKTRVYDGVLGKIDGNPYSPQNMLVHLDYETPLEQGDKTDGKLCPKGQAGIQSLYDPYRIRKVLKRAGPRGSSEWRSIPFDQAIREIVEGGRLFADVAGEENREVRGLRDLYALRDPEVANSLSADASAVASGKMTVEDFKARHTDQLDLLVDPDHPDFGPRNNEFVFLAGRIEHGRKEFSKRFVNDAFGSANWFEHTSICEQSHHIAYEQLTHQWKDGKWTGGKTHLKPDARNAEFVVYFGTSPFESNFGPPIMAEKITDGVASGRLKIAVVDPRFSKTASKAWKWLPVVPGGDAALALGMTRWIIENGRYDREFLGAANKAAAAAADETCWTDASWLVEIAADGPAGYVRAGAAGVGGDGEFVAVAAGRPVAFDPNDEDDAVVGDLMYEGRIGGKPVKTAFRLLWEEASARTMSEWSEICGIPADDIEAVARELTSHGKRAAVELYRGPVKHTNGYNSAQALIGLNLLIGNLDWAGGLQIGGGHWHELGDKRKGPFEMAKFHPGKTKKFGVKLTREGSSYEESTLFGEGYPARRPWYPFTGNVYQEVLPSAATAYPYRIGAVLMHKATPALSVPAANLQIAAMLDLEAVPLLLASDIVIGESSMYADYIFPDVSVWERWGTPHTTPDAQTAASKVRQPVVAPIPETVTVFGEQVPLGLESVMLAVAEQLDLPGYGPEGFGAGMPFTRPEHYYLKLVANLAAGDKEGDEVPPADAAEVERFLAARGHLPPEVFDPAVWEAAVGSDWWPRVVHVLNRGGRFENASGAYKGGRAGHTYKSLIRFYVETVATARSSMTGERFPGIGKHVPVADALGRAVEDADYPLTAITYKMITGGQSRTIADYWLSSIQSENAVLVNAATASELGLKSGQTVRVVSASNAEGQWELGNGHTRGIVGVLRATQGLRPGVVAVSWHYGHWAYGAEDVVVDGESIPGDGRRGTGLCTNAVLRADPHLKNVCLTDPVGGSASFYDTRVALVPA